MTDRNATINLSDGSPAVAYPILSGTIGPDVIDIRTLYGKTGKFTYDPGFLSTASCSRRSRTSTATRGSSCTGLPDRGAATRCDFMETCYLLLYGELPTPDQKATFTALVTRHTMVNEQMQFFLRGFRRDAHPMAVMTASSAR